jgi:predicted aspartyl protease
MDLPKMVHARYGGEMQRGRELDGAGSDIQMETEPLPFVPLHLNGKGPYIFLVDTGYLGFNLSSHVVEELRLEATDNQVAHVGNLAIGNYSIDDLRINVSDNSRISALMKRKIDGLMGMGFLKYFQTVLDYPESAMSLCFLDAFVGRTPIAQPDVAYVRVKSPNRYVVVPVHINGSGPYAFLLDTGARKCIVSPRIADELHLPRGNAGTARGAVDEKPVESSTVHNLSVAGKSAEDLAVSVMDCSHASEYAGAPIDGYIGHNFLKGFRWIINVLDLFVGVG